MKMPTSNATMTRVKGKAWSGANVERIRTEPTPSNRAAAARNARLKSSSLRRDGLRVMGDWNRQKKRAAGKPRRSVHLRLRAHWHCGAPSLVAGANDVEPT